MALYNDIDFDLNSVGIPLTGMAAFAPVTEASVLTDELLSSPTLTLPPAYRSLGLFKEDGGPQDAREDADAIAFFQEGYKISGTSTVTIALNLAEDNDAVNALLDGKTPNDKGVVYVDSALPSTTFLLFVATRYKSGRELRRNGVARIQAIEVDQETRGEVRGKAVTFEWVPSPLFSMSPFKKWLGIPGTVTVEVSPKTVSVARNATTRLTATVTPAGLRPTWSSASDTTATVSQDGTVTGVAEGETTITATVGSVKDSCTVTVTA